MHDQTIGELHSPPHGAISSLSATVTNLQAKMETLITTNALMKEDLAIAKNTILHMQEDNDRLRKDKGLLTQQQQEQLDREVRPAPSCLHACFYAMTNHMLEYNFHMFYFYIIWAWHLAFYFLYHLSAGLRKKWI